MLANIQVVPAFRCLSYWHRQDESERRGRRMYGCAVCYILIGPRGLEGEEVKPDIVHSVSMWWLTAERPVLIVY